MKFFGLIKDNGLLEQFKIRMKTRLKYSHQQQGILEKRMENFHLALLLYYLPEFLVYLLEERHDAFVIQNERWS